MVVAPGERVVHVHDVPGASAVTDHTSDGKRGCLIRARDVGAERPGRRASSTEVTEAVHVGQRSTSLYTAQTASIGASMVISSCTIMNQMVH